MDPAQVEPPVDLVPKVLPKIDRVIIDAHPDLEYRRVAQHIHQAGGPPLLIRVEVRQVHDEARVTARNLQQRWRPSLASLEDRSRLRVLRHAVLKSALCSVGQRMRSSGQGRLADARVQPG